MEVVQIEKVGEGIEIRLEEEVMGDLSIVGNVVISHENVWSPNMTVISSIPIACHSVDASHKLFNDLVTTIRENAM